MPRTYLSARLRREFRECLVGIPLGRIRDYFDAEGFEEAEQTPLNVSGERRSLVERYYALIDWDSWQACQRVLRIYEAVLDQMAARAAMTHDSDEERTILGSRQQLLDLLARDGVQPDQHGALRPVWDPFGSAATEQLPSESAVLHDLDRMRQSVEAEPDAAVGAAKDAVESAIKFGLHTLGVPLNGKEKLPELADALHRELGLHPKSFGPDAKGEAAIKKVLGSLITQVQAMAELRNLYGVGKGRVNRSALKPRHARLAAKAADAYVTFVLDTLQDRGAPWRKNQNPGGATPS